MTVFSSLSSSINNNNNIYSILRIALCSPSLSVSKQSRSLQQTSSVKLFSAVKVHDEKGIIQDEVRSSRSLRQSGVLLGTTFLSMAVSIGIVEGIIDWNMVALSISASTVAFIANTLSHNEFRSPLPNSSFEVRTSLISNAGKGLYTVEKITRGSFIMDYEGEILNEEEYFARHPDGQGRYVAVIPEMIPLPILGRLSEPTYIDAEKVDKSGLARYINSQNANEGKGPNLRWKKQRFGSPGMHFYAIRDINDGEELYYDYGSTYWDAVVEDDDNNK
mmetsp:Transcript_27545/g.34086  ORF Transcript_27545/g.34086 Transcript_27545/m.34086 type:complete len:276 (+) Transcript_27545:194-1021(+)